MACIAKTGRPLVKPTGLEGAEFCPEIQSNYTIVQAERTEISRCNDIGFHELFGTGEPWSFWQEDLDAQVTGRVSYYPYEIPVEGFAHAKFSDVIEVNGYGSGWLEGFVSGQGEIGGVVTGRATGYAGLPTGEELRATQNVIEGATGMYYKWIYATGVMTHEFDIEGSGIASDFLMAYGRVTGSINVTVGAPVDTSTTEGSFRFQGNVTGEAYDIYRTTSSPSHVDPNFDGDFNKLEIAGLNHLSNHGFQSKIDNGFIYTSLYRKGIEVRSIWDGSKEPWATGILPENKVSVLHVHNNYLYAAYTNEFNAFKVERFNITNTENITSEEINPFGFFGDNTNILSPRKNQFSFQDLYVYGNFLYCFSPEDIYKHDLVGSSNTSISLNSLLPAGVVGPIYNAKFHNGYVYFVARDAHASNNVFGRCILDGPPIADDFFIVENDSLCGEAKRPSRVWDFQFDGDFVYICGLFQNVRKIGSSNTSKTSIAKLNYNTKTVDSWQSSIVNICNEHDFHTPEFHEVSWRPWAAPWLIYRTIRNSEVNEIYSIGIGPNVILAETKKTIISEFDATVRVFYSLLHKGSSSIISEISETSPFFPGVIHSSNDGIYFVGINYGTYQTKNENGALTSYVGSFEKLWKINNVTVQAGLTSNSPFTGYLDAMITATGNFTEFTTGYFAGEASDLTGVIYASGSLQDHIGIFDDGAGETEYCVTRFMKGMPSNLQPIANYSHHQIEETGAYDITAVSPMEGLVDSCFTGLADYVEDGLGVYDFAWANYDVSAGANTKNMNALALTLIDNISGEGVNSNGDPTRIFYSGYPVECDNDEMKKALREIAKKRGDEEEEEEEKCKQTCGDPNAEFSDSERGGGLNGGGADAPTADDSTIEDFYVLYSGRIEFNDPAPGDKIVFKTYNFNYNEEYKDAYPENPNPLFPEYSFELRFGIDYTNVNNLIAEINTRLNTNRNLWLFYRPTYFPEEELGMYRNGPFLKARKLNDNEIEIVSLQPGRLGDYVIKSIPFEDDRDGVKYKLPIDIKIQGSNNKNDWVNLHKESNVDWSNAMTKSLEVKGSNKFNYHQDKFIEIRDNHLDMDAFHLVDFNNAVYQNEEEVTSFNVNYVKFKLEDDFQTVFDSVDLPSSPPGLDDFQYRAIEVLVNVGGTETTYLISLTALESEDKLDDNGDFQLTILTECPTPLVKYQRTFTKSVVTGIDSEGNPISVSINENVDCERCEGHLYIDGEELKGYVSCEQKEKKENDEGERSVLFEGVISTITTTNVFDASIFVGATVKGKYLFNKNAQNINRSDRVGIYTNNGIEIQFGNYTLRSRDFGVERELPQEYQERIIYNQLVTGYQFCNEDNYNFYRVVFDGFRYSDVENFIESSRLNVRNIALYGDYDFSSLITGSGKESVIDADYTGNILLLKTGLITGTDSGIANEFGIYREEGMRTGIPDETFYNPESPFQELVPYAPFEAYYDNIIIGVDTLEAEVIGHFYDPILNKIYGSHTISSEVTGKGPITGEAFVIKDIALQNIDQTELVVINTGGVFSGKIPDHPVEGEDFEAFTYFEGQSGVSITGNSGTWHFYETFEMEPTGSVYWISATGYKNATAEITYNTPQIWDTLLIDGEQFTYNPNLGFDAPLYYSDIDELVSIINNESYRFSAIKDGLNIQLNALISGDSGNEITIFSQGSNTRPEAATNTFTGGENYHPELTAVPNYDFIGVLDKIVTNTGYYEIEGEGYITGYHEVYTGTRTFTGLWAIYTGEYYPEVNFREDGLISGDYYHSLGFTDLGTMPSSLRVFIEYSNLGLDSGEADYALLTVTGQNGMSGIQVLISGR